MKKLILVSFLFLSLVSFGQVQYPNGFPSTVNSSTSTLTSGSVFTGTSEDITQMAEARIYVFSDVASATDGLSIQQSSNGTNWDINDNYTIPAGTAKAFGVGTSGIKFRIVYTNGATNQAAFRLQVVYHRYRTKPSSQRPQDARTNDNDMEEVLAYNNIYDPVNNVWNRQTTFQNPIGATAQTATVNNIIGATSGTTGTNVNQYNFGSIQVVSTGTAGTFIFEGANSDASYVTIPVWNQATLTGTPITAAITATASTFVYYFPITTSFVRLRIASTITGGSIQAISKFSTTAPFPTAFSVANATGTNLNVGTVSTVSSVTAVATVNGGPTASSAASANNPEQIGGVTVPTTVATQDQTFVAGDVQKLPLSTGAQVITKPFATAEIDWNSQQAAITDNTSHAVRAASGTAGIRNYVTGLQIINSSATISTEVQILDGATVIWRGFVGSNLIANSVVGVNFLTPLKGTANTAVNFQAVTTGANIYVAAQGYTGL